MKRILEFLENESGRFSSTRLFMLLVCFTSITDWLYSVFTIGKWSPDNSVLLFITTVLGLKIFENKKMSNEL